MAYRVRYQSHQDVWVNRHYEQCSALGRLLGQRGNPLPWARRASYGPSAVLQIFALVVW